MSDSLSRRAFLQSTAALAAATTFSPALALPTPPELIPYPENGTLIPDDGWHLWLDREAKWAEDDLYLPEEPVVRRVLQIPHRLHPPQP